MNDDSTKIGEADVYGDLTTVDLDRKIAISKVSQQSKHPTIKATSWPKWEPTIRDFLASLTKHRPCRKKELAGAFTGGLCIEGVRQKKAIKHMDLMIFDIDAAVPVEDIRKTLQGAKLLSVIYTSYSHAKTSTKIPFEDVAKWNGKAAGDASIEELCSYLASKERYPAETLQGVAMEVASQASSGMVFNVSHSKLTKVRVVLFLKDRWTLAEHNLDISKAAEEWRSYYFGSAIGLGFPVDPKTSHVNALFYVPSYDPESDRERRIEIIAGDLFDVSKVTPCSAKELADMGKSAFDLAAEEMQAGEDQERKTPGLLAWWVKNKGNFDAVEFFRSHPDSWDEKGATSDGKGYRFTCPNDSEHSNAGDPEDSGVGVWNSEDSSCGLAVLECKHEHCEHTGPKGQHDSLPLLDLACQQAGIKDASELDRWVPELVEGDKPSSGGGSPAAAVSEAPKTTVKRKGAKKVKTKDEKETAAEEAAFAEAVQEFHETWGFVAEGATGRFVRTKPDGELEFKQEGAIMRLYEDRSILRMSESGNVRRINPVKEWLSLPEYGTGRYTGLLFLPGKTRDEAEPYYNSWRGYGVVPRKGEWPLLRAHIAEVLTAGNAQDDLFVMGWMAWVLRNIGNLKKKLTISPVIRGDEGAGKSMVFEFFSAILGRHGITMSKPEQVIGRFNSLLGELLFGLLEEALFAGDPKIVGPFNDLLTGRNLTIERKGIDSVVQSNFAHFAVNSNAKRPVPINGHSRRYYPIECSSAKIGQQAYFDVIFAEMENGGLEAMAWDLLHEWSPPGDDWSFLTKFPKSVAGDRMIAAGLAPIERFILEWVWDSETYMENAPALSDEAEAPIMIRDLCSAFEAWADVNVRMRHEQDATKTDPATVGLKLREMIPGATATHSRKGNGRLFPKRGDIIKSLRSDLNGGFGAYLDRLGEAAGGEGSDV